MKKPKKKEEEDEEEKEKLYDPGWLDDPLLNDFQISDLTPQETRFWELLLKKYLHPLFQTDEQKDKVKKELKALRDIVCFAFIMINALFVLVVLLLQIQKDYLHLRWPFNAKDTITFTDKNHEVIIFRKYLELDPIGLVFVVFFGLILAIQFVAMLFHRFGTISQILATTELNMFCCASEEDQENAVIEELRGTTVEIAKKTQKPKRIDEDDSDVDDDTKEPLRRNTIYRLTALQNFNDPNDWSDLQTNFERRYEEGKLKYGELPVRRKTKHRLEETRKSVIHRRKTVLNDRKQNGGNPYMNGGNDNPGYMD